MVDRARTVLDQTLQLMDLMFQPFDVASASSTLVGWVDCTHDAKTQASRTGRSFGLASDFALTACSTGQARSFAWW